MKRLLIALLTAGSIFAQSPVEGTWLGTLATPMGKLRIVLRVKPDNTATMQSLDQAPNQFPLDKFTAADGNVAFELAQFKVSYEGKLSADGKSIEGTMTQGTPVPLVLSKTTEEAITATMPKKGRPLTDGERSAAVALLESSRDHLKASIAGLSEEQLKWKAAPERWSVTEVVEHLALIEPFLFTLASKQLMQVPGKPEIEARSAEDLAVQDKKLVEGYQDRSRKAQAPEPAKPTGKFANAQAGYDEFVKQRVITIDYIRTTQGDLRSHAMPIGPGVMADAYQMVLLLAGHAERHIKQIEEVKADSGFPKK